jgi:hypothetical protein
MLYSAATRAIDGQVLRNSPSRRLPVKRSLKLFSETLCLFVVSALPIGCHSGSDPVVNEVVEKRPSIMVSDLPTKFLDAIDTSTDSTIKAKLRTQDSLTLDGTTLTIGNVGDNRTVTLACHKLKLTNGARIVTNGNNLTLLALTMDFNNSGGIDSFLGDTLKAQPGRRGSDGGRVEIYATDSVYGSLRVSLAGQSGGDGVQGAKGLPGSQGPPGGGAADGPVFNCLHPGEVGGKGSSGGAGFPGRNGVEGGDGGDFVLHGQAAKNYDSRFPFTAPPGPGGVGGNGGDGGDGGPGGIGGSGSKYCGGGHAGDPGPQGPAGPKGEDGHAGKSVGTRRLK